MEFPQPFIVHNPKELCILRIPSGFPHKPDYILSRIPTHNHLVCERSPVLGASLRIIQSRGVITVPCVVNTGPYHIPVIG